MDTMTALYRRPGASPMPLPLIAHDNQGQAWTDLANSEEGRIATGWNDVAPARPADTEAQVAEWEGEAGEWVMVDRPPPPPPTSDDVNAERDRRIRAGFVFGAHPYDYDDASQKRITGAATLAGFAAANGAQPGDLMWHGGADPFTWIAQDNAMVQMDAQTCFALGQTAAAHESAHVFAAKALKETEGGIPADYADDSRWP